MRLLQIDSDDVVSLAGSFSDTIPPYAILSHTWGPDDEEVTFEELSRGLGKSKVGYEKIQFCGQQARQDGFRYFWVDTCCIHKANLTELSESITSMFRWYRDAATCYVYLSDVSAAKRGHEGGSLWARAFRSCRWFTRGWTLQELLAPSSIKFFSREKQLLGDKQTLRPMITDITGIPDAALKGEPLSSFDVSRRMQWAASRGTKKPEDMVYCLRGIFEVSFVPNYGEGSQHALIRLKDAVCDKYRRDIHDLKFSVPKDAPTPAASGNEQSDTRRQDLLNSLAFPQMDSRRATIKSEHSTTCAWLLEDPEYTRWSEPGGFEEHGGFMWLKGKPGAGKSTLVKFAHARARGSASDEEIVVAFFLNARGDILEKSTTGLYRSLLFQLLERAPDLQDIPEDTFMASQSRSSIWTLETLRESFTAAVQGLGRRRLRCFIDALD